MNRATVSRMVTFRSQEEKANWLDAMASLDARLPEVNKLGARFAMAPRHDPNQPIALARDFQKFVRDSIRYVRDPHAEEFSDSDTILLRGYGDCDDKARLFVALCRRCGIESRIRPCFTGPDFVHVQAEVALPSSYEPARHEVVLEDQSGRWLLCELIVAGLELGEGPPRRGRVLV